MIFSELVNLMFDYWFYGILIVYFILFLVLYLIYYRRIKNDFVMTEAVVIKIRRNSFRKYKGCTLIMQYNVGYKAYKCYRRIDSSIALKDYPIGTKVDVWYHKDDPYFWRLRVFF